MADGKWALVIEHRFGTNTRICDSEEQARAELLTFVHDWWGEVAGRCGLPNRPPECADEAIDCYFEAQPDEVYTLSPAD